MKLKLLFWIFILMIVMWGSFLKSSVFAETIQESIKAANFLAEKWIIENASSTPTQYKLMYSISRREILKIMIGVTELELPSQCTQTFWDLPASDWGCKYAQVALASGLIAKNHSFRPDENVTQIEALKMLMSASGIAKNQSSDWRAGYVSKAYELGVLENNYLAYDTQALRWWIFISAEALYPFKKILGQMIEAPTPWKTSLTQWITQKSIMIEWDERWYNIYAPQTDVTGLPLLLYLHGGGQSMEIGTGLIDLAQKNNFVIIAPNGVDIDTGAFINGSNTRWNDHRDNSSEGEIIETVNDELFLETIVKNTHSSYGTDTKRTYAMWPSNGAYMTQYMISQKPELFAAAASFLVAIPPNSVDTIFPKNTNTIPLMVLVGTKDPIINYNWIPEKVLSWDASGDVWADWSGVTRNKTAEIITEADYNGCYTTLEKYDTPTPLYLYRSVGGGHVIPSINNPYPQQARDSAGFQAKFGLQCIDFDTFDTAWDFMKQYSK